MYDLRREQDTINPHTCADVMVLSHEEEKTHPYWYAHVIGIFHINVEYRQDDAGSYSHPTQMDFLFIRWFQRDISPAGWAAKQLHHLQFFNDNSPDTYGFLDPNCVIHGVHLIPGFAYPIDYEDLNSDWWFYYLNM